MKEIWLIYRHKTYMICNSPTYGESVNCSGTLENALDDLREILPDREESKVNVEGVSKKALRSIQRGLSDRQVTYEERKR